MTREEFISKHLKTCQAKRVLKYDVKKSGAAVHSLAYSRRKCAKTCWKAHLKTRKARCR